MDLLQIDIALARRAFDLRVALSLGAETVALVGPSGAGKSSLLRAVAGLEQPGTGRIAFDGRPWFDRSQRIHLGPAQRRVGYVPQDYGLFPHLTVDGNVRFAARRPRPDLLVRLGIEHLSGARPHQLSGGERQRVALARALARDPRVLLLDEPFGALDPLTRTRVRDELSEILAGLPLATLLVTHAFSDASVLADRVGVIDHGRLIQVGRPDDLLDRPAAVTVAAITGANILPGAGREAAGGGVVALAAGGELPVAAPARGPVLAAVHPWRIGLAEPSASGLTDTVVSVHRERGGLVVRGLHFRIELAGAEDAPAPAPGEQVGLIIDPRDVHVFPAEGGRLPAPAHAPVPG